MRREFSAESAPPALICEGEAGSDLFSLACVVGGERVLSGKIRSSAEGCVLLELLHVLAAQHFSGKRGGTRSARPAFRAGKRSFSADPAVGHDPLWASCFVGCRRSFQADAKEAMAVEEGS